MKKHPFSIRVEHRSGYREEYTPQRFFIGDHAIEIEEIIDRWLAPELSYIKVRAAQNDIYILRHDELAHQWELTLFQSGKFHDSSSPT